MGQVITTLIAVAITCTVNWLVFVVYLETMSTALSLVASLTGVLIAEATKSSKNGDRKR